MLEWLQHLQMAGYHDALTADGYYDDIDHVVEITWEDLEEIGIKKLGIFKLSVLWFLISSAFIQNTDRSFDILQFILLFNKQPHSCLFQYFDGCIYLNFWFNVNLNRRVSEIQQCAEFVKTSDFVSRLVPSVL